MPVSSPFNAVSLQEHAISHLFVVVLFILGGILLVVSGLVIWILLTNKSRQHQEPKQNFGNVTLEIVWTAIPILLLAVVLVFTVKTIYVSDPPPGKRSPDMLIVAHQWWWEVHYQSSGVVTANEIHLPVDQPMLARFETADVIHDFWVPQLGRKIDIIPGHTNYLWLDPNKQGTFLGTCGEFCGAEHAWMRLRVIVQAQPEFNAWLQQQLRMPSQPTAPDQVEGAELFRQLTCVNCHAISGTGYAARLGPDLTHLGSRQTLAAGALDNNASNLTAWLKNPQAWKPGSYMPNLQLSDTQVRALVAYLETLR